MTTREAILQALAAMLATVPELFPPAAIDEPEPSAWTPLGALGDDARTLHAAAVQDGPPPDHLGFVRGGAGGDELELEAAIAYAVQYQPGPGDDAAKAREIRRAVRDRAAPIVAALIAADRTLGLGHDVWAEVQPVQRDDAVSFANAVPTATAVIPIRVLYTADHPAA